MSATVRQLSPEAQEQKKKTFPVRVNRDLGLTLTEQLRRGVIAAIGNEYYRHGDRLPTLLEIAKASGASVMVVRNAFQKLIAEGHVVAKRRFGMSVRVAEEKPWSGIALILLPRGETEQRHRFWHLQEALNQRCVHGMSLEVSSPIQASEQRQFKSLLSSVSAVIPLGLKSSQIRALGLDATRVMNPLVSFVQGC